MTVIIAILKKLLFAVIVTVCVQPAFAQTPECYKFKEGKFKIADPNAGGIFITERKGNYQTESNEGLKTTLKFRITWLDDCTYILKLETIIRNENKLPIPKGISVSVKILSTTKTSCIQEVTSSLYNRPYQCEAIKIQ